MYEVRKSKEDIMDFIRIVIVVIVGIMLLALQNKLSKNIGTGIIIPIVVLVMGFAECILYEKKGITFQNLLPFFIIDFVLITELVEVKLAMKKNNEAKNES